MTIELYLIGTQHFDPNGPRRLRKLLENKRPEVITVETDQDRIDNLENYWRELTPEKLERVAIDLHQRMPGSHIEGIRNYLTVSGYEYKEAKLYADSHGIEIIPVDKFDEEFQAAKGDWNHPINRDSVKFLKVNIPRLRELVERRYNEETIKIPEGIKVTSLEYRDAHMEAKIREQHGRVVHIGGMAHFYGAYINLYDRLRSLGAKKIKLNEADKI
ncbi:MAG TPA: hypothetical protein VJI68_02270 [Candidatus Nanoarchaeia archaeon]|nr:hypothetical protein [Candidatus Nanoarchaeia archaeon]